MDVSLDVAANPVQPVVVPQVNPSRPPSKCEFCQEMIKADEKGHDQCSEASKYINHNCNICDLQFQSLQMVYKHVIGNHLNQVSDIQSAEKQQEEKQRLQLLKQQEEQQRMQRQYQKQQELQYSPVSSSTQLAANSISPSNVYHTKSSPTTAVSPLQLQKTSPGHLMHHNSTNRIQSSPTNNSRGNQVLQNNVPGNHLIPKNCSPSNSNQLVQHQKTSPLGTSQTSTKMITSAKSNSTVPTSAQHLIQQLQYPSQNVITTSNNFQGITPQNASQLLATMQPTPPSSLGTHTYAYSTTPLNNTNASTSANIIVSSQNSQQQQQPQSFLYTLPQHSASPSFDVSMLQPQKTNDTNFQPYMPK